MADGLTEVRVAVPDRPGLPSGVTTVADELGITIYDLRITRKHGGEQQALVLVVDTHAAQRLSDALAGQGFDLNGS